VENEADVGQADWQHDEIQAAIEELEAGLGISHDTVAIWLKSWGTPKEQSAPR